MVRALVATFAVLLIGFVSTATAAPCAGFTDVDAADQFCTEVTWIKNRGVTLGCTATQYCPAADVTRLQMALFMYRLGNALFPSTCVAGQVMKWNGTAWACAADATAGGGGTVSSVTAGSGLTGGTITSSGTIGVDTSYVQRRVSTSCAAGSSIRAIAADGTVTCEADDTGPANAFVQGGNAFGAVAKVGTTDSFAVEILAGGKRAIRVEPHAGSPQIISGYENNGAYANVLGATIAGGGIGGSSYAAIACPYAFGCQNSVTEQFGTIGGGLGNIAGEADGDLDNNAFGTVAGGAANSALHFGAVGGGYKNQALAQYAVVAGGANNVVSNSFAAIGGGGSNQASGFGSFVAGGFSNHATGYYSFASGTDAKANADGCVVFANGNPTQEDVICGGANRFVVLAAGGFFLYSNASGAGVTLAPGASAFAPASDRALKTGIDRVDIAQVLDRVVALPISTWRWKDEVSQSLHMGPMAQDFHAAFGLGDDEKRIVTVDADGVALAAIQGLNAKVEHRLAAKDAEIAALRAELADLRSLKAEVASIRAAQSRGSLAQRQDLTLGE